MAINTSVSPLDDSTSFTFFQTLLPEPPNLKVMKFDCGEEHVTNIFLIDGHFDRRIQTQQLCFDLRRDWLWYTQNMTRRRAIDGRKLNAVLDKYGGWERVMSPRFELTDEVILEFESVGFYRELLLSTREFNSLPVKEQCIRTTAREFAYEWHRSKMAIARHEKRKQMGWPAPPSWDRTREIFWKRVEKQMVGLDVTKEEVKSHLEAHPNPQYSEALAGWD